MRRVYSLLIGIAAPLAFAVLLWRGLRDRGYWQGLGQRFGYGGTRTGAAPIWLHAVSLGEVAAAAPLVRALRAGNPQVPLVLTSATPAGRASALRLFGDVADVRFVPYDTPGSVRRFLRRIRPRLAVIMETELWPNLFRECARRGVPLLLANARLSARSVSRYRWFGALFREVFTDNVLVAAQTDEDAARFAAIGAPPRRIRVVGNVKFDLELDADTEARGRALRAQFGAERTVWIAGSTHAGEDEAVLEAHRRLLEADATALLLLAPRHRDRFESVAALLRTQGFRVARRADAGAVTAATQVLLVDTLGELAALYATADIAFVGGSLVPIGGHNLLEPAALGIAVLTGPHVANSREVASRLLACGALLEVADAQQLADALRRLAADAGLRRRMGIAGRQMVAANRGSVQRLLEITAPWLAASP